MPICKSYRPSGFGYWNSGDIMPRIYDSILNCSIYLYASRQDAEEGEKSGGSGFIAEVDSSLIDFGGFFYAVTNSHVIIEGKSSVIRVNTTKDDFAIIETDARDWYHHPDGDDLAVIPFHPDITRYRLLHVPLELFITRQLMKDANLGAGDEIFMVGRFIGYDGKQQNEPIVRFGNLSLTNPVPIKHERGYRQESFLVEMRSLSGFSGSPVFIPIEISPLNMPRPQAGELYTHEEAPYLLGIDWGHRNVYEEVLEKQPDENGHDICVEEGWKVKTNTGISYVIPAWKLRELLYIEELVEMRRKTEEYLERRAKELRKPKETGTSLDVLTKNEFHKILDKASQPIKFEDESDSGKSET